MTATARKRIMTSGRRQNSIPMVTSGNGKDSIPDPTGRGLVGQPRSDHDLINVYDICIKPALIVPQMMHVKYVARMMIAQFQRRVVVLECGKLIGLVTMNDIVGEVLAMADDSHIEGVRE